MVAIAVIAIVATMVIPNFMGSRPGAARKHFIGQLNALMIYARQNAIITGQVHQVVFDFSKKTITLNYQTGQKNPKGEPEYKQVQGKYLKTVIEIPDAVDTRNFYIEGFDEMSRFSGRKTGTAYFFIVPSGLAQEVVINFIDTDDRLYNGAQRQIGLVLNPFTAQFKEYDAFAKP